MNREEFTQQSLDECFKERGAWTTNRASALFPVFLRPDTDTLLTFLDYWQLKNKLAPVSCFIRVYSGAGELVFSRSEKIVQAHTLYSLREFLGEGNFDGMVEIEFASAQNLKFSFPAVNAFYRSGTHYSVVHGGGRVRSGNEGYIPRKSIETNWTCKFKDDVVPFFHLFNGPRWSGLGTNKVDLFGADGQLIASVERNFGLEAPFSSKIVYLDEVFDLAGLKDKEFFVAITMPDAEFFPRMVVGNCHLKLNLLEAGHSFYWTTIDDYLEPRDDVSVLSFIPAIKTPELELNIVSYPTNAPCSVIGKVRTADVAGRLQPTDRQLSWGTGAGSPIWSYRLEDDVDFLSIDFLELPVPSRINASYRYKVKNAPSNNFSVDVATGAHAFIYPPKYSHWGSAIVSERYETVLMVRNVCQMKNRQRNASGLLRIYAAEGGLVSHSFSLCAESACCLYFSDLMQRPKEDSVVSWFLNSDCPDIETYWISYAADGSICGDHGF